MAVLLDGVVCQVDVSVAEVVDIVLEAGCSNVAFFVDVASEVDAVDDLSEGEHANVELPHGTLVPEATSEQQGRAYVFLNDPALT